MVAAMWKLTAEVHIELKNEYNLIIKQGVRVKYVFLEQKEVPKMHTNEGKLRNSCSIRDCFLNNWYCYRVFLVKYHSYSFYN